MSMNFVGLQGRLVRDPELRYTQQQTPVASFTLAVNRDVGEETDFIDVVAWKKTAEYVHKNYTKGAAMLIIGRLQIREWTDREGHKRRNAEIVADRVWPCEKKEKREENSEEREKNFEEREKMSAFGGLTDSEGDLPF